MIIEIRAVEDTADKAKYLVVQRRLKKRHATFFFLDKNDDC